MASYTDIAVTGSVENVQNLVQQAFVSNGFDIKWEGPSKGKAEKEQGGQPRPWGPRPALPGGV